MRAPAYDGAYVDALVPATLDLAERARLAVNALTEPLDPDVDYELYWAVDLLARTPVMYHQPADIVQDKFFGALPMMRTASGSTQNLDVEHFLMQVYLRKQGPDGLVYIPIPGRPWGMPVDPQPWDAIDRIPDGDFWSPLHMTGRVLGAFTIYALKDPAGPWAAAAEALVDGFRTVTIDEGQHGYFFAMSTEPGRQVNAPSQPPRGQRAATQGWAAQELAQCGRLLGVDRAAELARRLSRYTMFEAGYFGSDGAFTYEWPETSDRSIHFHSHTLQIVAALMVVRATGDEELLERALIAYEWAKEQGETTVGFFPEWLSYRVDNFGVGPNSSEICEVADMVTAAVLLCRLGVDRWDDVDRWVRNMLAEGQLTDVEWLFDGHLVGLDRGARDGDQAATTDRVPERVIGSFAGWPNVNDFVMDEKTSIMHCCTGNGTRAVYAAWESVLERADGRLRVNLLLNRSSEWADIDSYLPYQGRVDIMMKQRLAVDVRVPEWIDPADAVVSVGGSDRRASVRGRYLDVGEVAAGEQIVVQFPVRRATARIVVEKHPYTIVRRGNEVVHIDPPGSNRPLFQRDHYRRGETLWRRTTRFVADRRLNWF